MWRWGRHKLSASRQNLVLARLLKLAGTPYRDANSSLAKRLLPPLQLAGLAVFYPDLLSERQFWLLCRRVMLRFGLCEVLASIKRRLSHAP